MTQRKPSLPTPMSSEPIAPRAKHQTLWVFLLFVALLGFLGWVFPRNPGSNPTATLSQNNAPSNHPSSLGEATAPRSTTRLGQARGPEPVRKIDDEIARILQGDFITNVYTLSSNKTLVEVGKLPAIFRKWFLVISSGIGGGLDGHWMMPCDDTRGNIWTIAGAW